MIQTDKGHFVLTFKNGYTISVLNCFGSFSENHFKFNLLKKDKFDSINSKDCEIAIMYNEIFVTGIFLECGDMVKGYVSADELADIIYKVKNFKGDSNVKNKRNNK